MAQPRDPTGRWACVPAYPRKHPSPCGCSGGGSRPCPTARRLRPVRDRARQKRRLELKRTRLAGDLQELHSELYSVTAERAALRDSLEYTRAQIREAGSVHHRAGRTGRKGYTAAGRSSESTYAALLERREQDRAHDAHLRSEAASIRRLITATRAKARRRRRAA